MKSLFTFPFISSLALALVPSTHLKPFLDPTIPIYLGEIFFPPSLTVISWLPTTIIYDLDWCMKATEAYPEKLFSLSGVDALQIHDYFTDHAYITREAKRFAECYVTPESVKMGSCQGAKDWDCEGGHKFTGSGTRKWTCWINDRRRREEMDGRSARADGLTDAEVKQKTTSIMTRAATGSSLLGAFTPGVTGR